MRLAKVRDHSLPTLEHLPFNLVCFCLQAFCSSIVAALAAQAMLKAYGVGDEKATILAATFTWLLKGSPLNLYISENPHSP